MGHIWVNGQWGCSLMPHSHLRLALEVLHVPVVQVPQVPREHCVGAVAVAVGAHAGQVVFSQSNDAALGGVTNHDTERDIFTFNDQLLIAVSRHCSEGVFSPF